MNKWKIAKKTKGLKAKPMINLIADKMFINKFLLETLEGREFIDPDTVFCVGEYGDVWQQKPLSLLKKYDVVNIEEGWLICVPKPDNSVECYESGINQLIKGKWGETINNIPNQQRCFIGDFVLRNPSDHSDQWVVQRKIFLNTYEFI